MLKFPKSYLWPISPCMKYEGEGDPPADPPVGGGDPPVATVVLDGDMNFVENWKEHLPEEIRDEPSLNNIANFPDAIKQLVHAQKTVGKDKVILPGEEASDEDWNEFYNQVGRPKTAGDYPYERPEDVPESERSDDRMEEIRKFAHATNMTVKQFKRMMEREDAEVIDRKKVDEATVELALDEAEQKLKDLWGMAYDEKIHIVNRFINETTKEGDKRTAFIKEFGRNPVFVEWAAEVGKTMVEHEVLIADITQKAPKEAQAELDEYMASGEYSKYLRGDFERDNPSKHKAILKKVTDLYDVISPAQKAG